MNHRLSTLALMACAMGFSGNLWAQSPTEAQLLSAQLAYQQALKDKTKNQVNIGSLNQKLAAAQQRLVEAQSDVQKMQAELTQAQAAQATTESQLQNASSQLDAAWAAAKGQP